jgi:hypothetical protein
MESIFWLVFFLPCEKLNFFILLWQKFENKQLEIKSKNISLLAKCWSDMLKMYEKSTSCSIEICFYLTPLRQFIEACGA